MVPRMRMRLRQVALVAADLPPVEAAITDEVSQIRGVQAVHIDLEAKEVTVQGDEVDDARVRAAIEEAGYEIA